jgi:predicted nucleic acid-binding protein
VIVCDTGPLVAVALSNDQDHHACVELFTGLHLARRELLVPAPVIAEVGYLPGSRAGARAEALFLRSLTNGDFIPVDLNATDLIRMAELVEQYGDLPLGTTDAAVVGIAERLGISEIATLDERHFRVVRPRHISAFTILP